MQRRDLWGLIGVVFALAALITYRYYYIEPREWGAACVAAAAPAACIPRAGLLLLQRYYLWGTASLALGVWAFAGRGGFATQIAAVILGIAAVENYNATWGAVGAALGAWCWLRRQNWTSLAPSGRRV